MKIRNPSEGLLKIPLEMAMVDDKSRNGIESLYPAMNVVVEN